MIEGVGNEVVLSFVGSIVAILFFVFMRRLLRSRSAEIATGMRELADLPPAYNESICPICMNEHTLALETSCGHVYCGTCLRTYYEGVPSYDGMACPLCRQQVTLIFIYFSAEERNADSESPVAVERNNIMNFVHRYNRMLSNDRTFSERISEIPMLIRHLVHNLLQDGDLGENYIHLRLVTFLIMGFFYVLSPLDIIPEIIYGMYGYLEDIVVVFLLVMYISHVYRNYVIGNN